VKPVAITGVGVLAPIGLDEADCLDALRGGECGLGPTGSERLAGMGVSGAGRVGACEPDDLDRVEHLAVVAARQALGAAGLCCEELPEDTAVCVSTSKGAVLSLERQLTEPGRGAPVMERVAPGGAALAVAREVRARGPVWCRPAACATGLVSVLAGAAEIAAGRTRIALAGASEASLSEFIHAGFASMGALALGAADPAGAVRPFDRSRRGFLLGEGAAVLVLEDLDRALERGAKVRAVLTGWAETCEAHGVAAPQPGGEAELRAGRLALQRAGLEAREVDGLWLHGTATPKGDRAELAAMEGLFGAGSSRPAATASKGLTGHMLGASGAVELAFAVSCLGAGVLPAVANLTDPLPCSVLSLVRGAALELDARRYMVLSAGFGGHVAAVVVERDDPPGGGGRESSAAPNRPSGLQA
jgi:3-oxoacyl-[acyl-carrier-protein] synthase II